MKLYFIFCIIAILVPLSIGSSLENGAIRDCLQHTIYFYPDPLEHRNNPNYVFSTVNPVIVNQLRYLNMSIREELRYLEASKHTVSGAEAVDPFSSSYFQQQRVWYQQHWSQCRIILLDTTTTLQTLPAQQLDFKYYVFDILYGMSYLRVKDPSFIALVVQETLKLEDQLTHFKKYHHKLPLTSVFLMLKIQYGPTVTSAASRSMLHVFCGTCSNPKFHRLPHIPGDKLRLGVLQSIWNQYHSDLNGVLIMHSFSKTSLGRLLLKPDCEMKFPNYYNGFT